MTAASDAGAGALVMSLDFELAWGIPDEDLARLSPGVAGARAAVDALLRCFERHRACATWATVGALMARDPDDLRAWAPPARERGVAPGRRPSRHDGRFDGPLPYFAPDLVRRVHETPGQEVGCHSFSHRSAVEGDERDLAFAEQLAASCAIAARDGIELRSLVFPYNAYDAAALRIAADAGIAVARTNPPHWAHTPRAPASHAPHRRAYRLLDQYLPLTSGERLAAHVRAGAPVQLPASRYLRPAGREPALATRARLRRVCDELTHAAARDRVVHLWWHPHNFGVDLERNLAFVDAVLQHLATLRSRYGMVSQTMRAAARAL